MYIKYRLAGSQNSGQSEGGREEVRGGDEEERGMEGREEYLSHTLHNI